MSSSWEIYLDVKIIEQIRFVSLLEFIRKERMNLDEIHNLKKISIR